MLSKIKRIWIFPGLVFLFIIVMLFLQYFTNLYNLLSNSYFINEANLYKVDTFLLQGRAYEYGGGKNSSPTFRFTSTSGYSFSIDEQASHAIIDKAELRDTLMYHELAFIPYTTRETFDLYRKSNEPIRIPVFQLMVGNKKYIDIKKANSIKRTSLINDAVIPPVFLLFVVIFINNNNKWTEAEKSVWGAIFLFTLLGLSLFISAFF